jgi:hypothetical protein
MNSRRLLLLFVSVAISSFATLSFAAKKGGSNTTKGTPLTASFLSNNSTTGAGISDDGYPVYENGAAGVQCYLGVAGKDLDLVTYNTGRTLHFALDPNSPAFQTSGLPQDFTAEIDIYGINYWGPYMSMGVGTTAQVQLDLQFKVGRNTFELSYQSLAVQRLSEDTWLVTSDHAHDIIWDPGFTASDQAALGVFRRRSNETFGAVNMPIRFEVKLK